MQLKPILALTQLINENIKPGFTMAEIGCYDGSTTTSYVEKLKQYAGKVHIVDWFYGNIGATGTHSYVQDELVYERFKIIFANYKEQMIIHRGPSHEQILNIPDDSLDLCFIDADHRYDYVYKDIELCLPKVKKGGIICGHDMENINILDEINIKKEWLEKDAVRCEELDIPEELATYSEFHLGVIKAVFDFFGKDIETRPDQEGQGVPIWIKRL